MIKYACVADAGNGARCRNMSLWPVVRCPEHQVVQTAPVPEIVKLCFSLQQFQWSKVLQGEGIPRISAKNRTEQARSIETHAQQFGHEAYAYRKDFPDSGTLVFCTAGPGILEKESLKHGLKNVSLWEAFKELLKIYYLGEVFIEPRQNKTDRLIIPFYKELTSPVSQEVSAEGMMQLLEKFVSSWNIHVYANPPRQDGKIVHTINAHGRQENPVVTLRFNNGLWAV